MAFRILIVEDQELYADQLEMMVEKLGYSHLATVNNSEDALATIKNEIPDLILMDIHIKGSHDGIELADMVHQKNPIPVIFITSLKDDLTFSRASRTNPLNFLLKPFDQTQLQRTIELTVKQLQTKKETEETTIDEWENDFLFQEYFFIKTRQKLEKVSVNNVLYLEADGHYCQVHTEQKKFLVRMSMSELIKRLPQEQFLQTHRSFLINSQKVESVDLEDSIVVVQGKHVPLSKRNREVLLKKLNWI